MSSRFFRPRSFAVGLLAVAVPTAVAVAMAVPGASAMTFGAENEFHQTNLISDRSDQGAQVVDPNLLNAWGLALSPTSPLWVADNNAGVATVYSINVGGTMAKKVNLTVTLPGGRASTGDGSSPTGQVFNPTSGFVVTSKAGSGPGLFIFSAEAGQISAWNPAADPVVNGASTAQVEFSSRTAVYKGLAIASNGRGTFLFASNFHDGRVDVFNSKFHRVRMPGNFRDPFLPAGYAPFGIQAIGGFIYVSYALQNAAKHDDVAGPGHGFIDIYTTDGFLVKRLVSRGDLNSPWGLAVAPQGFGPFGGDLLVGNFGDGLIHAYGLFSGRPHGALLDEQRQPIQIDDLWGLHFGTAATGGTSTLLFSAGINDEKDGLVGSINAVP
jgi:uncharacterized protein (TIGR03118 family)